ncbi:MAG: rhomboid family intramembrane serine protease [bacterium]|nr:MAG: rhomboid family intramembrane serine protease [bacterium]
MIPLRDNIPSRKVPFVTYVLVGANVLAFFFELSLGPNLERFIYIFGVVPQKVVYAVFEAPQLIPYALVPFLTSQFLHGGWLHLLGNMLFLYIFGDNVEGAFGHFRYLIFYLACGVAASMAHFLVNPSSTVPTVGASGAIAGILGAYFLLFPKARVLTLVPIFYFVQIVEIPAVLFLGLWFLIQFLSGSMALGTEAAAGVAWWAHIGGFIVGAGYTVVKLRKIRRRG